MHTLVRVKNAYTVMTICLIALGGQLCYLRHSLDLGLCAWCMECFS